MPRLLLPRRAGAMRAEVARTIEANDRDLIVDPRYTLDAYQETLQQLFQVVRRHGAAHS